MGCFYRQVGGHGEALRVLSLNPLLPPCDSSRFAKSSARKRGVRSTARLFLRFDFALRSASEGCFKRSSPLVPRGGSPLRIHLAISGVVSQRLIATS